MTLLQSAIEPLLHSDEPALQAAGRFYGHTGVGLDAFTEDELLLNTPPTATVGGVTIASANFIAFLLNQTTLRDSDKIVGVLVEIFKRTLEVNLKQMEK